MSTLCFGGSFNPIHHGHLICARAVAEKLGAQKVLVIPSYQPPHKTAGQGIAPAEDRAAICRLAVQDDPLFAVSDIELNRKGPSYTIDTVRQLKSDGWPHVRWLIGADMVRILPQWHEPLALLREMEFVILARPGWSFDWETLPPDFRHLAANVVPAPLIDITATDIRQRVRLGKSISYLVPPAVDAYIRSHGLYRSS